MKAGMAATNTFYEKQLGIFSCFAMDETQAFRLDGDASHSRHNIAQALDNMDHAETAVETKGVRSSRHDILQGSRLFMTSPSDAFHIAIGTAALFPIRRIDVNGVKRSALSTHSRIWR